ncbi:MAG: PQQ-binding-like beta-propeller repeat protein [Verrucomicrobia bacterium]|nr:PQQ-binding-like beta-propeller repeat protein [Verrucomicrobiota bacterium]
MKQTLLLKALPVGFAVVGGLAILFWWRGGSSRPLMERVPGLDQVAGAVATNGGNTTWEGKLIPGSATPPTGFNGVWPWFRGPDLNGVSTENVPLARSWPSSGPPVLWKLDVGEGFAAAAVWKGRVYIIDYDHKGQADALRCLSLADGREIWRYTYPVKVKRYHGMSRTIPAVTGKYVVSLGPKCHVICCDASTGELRWKMNLVREFNATVPEWYAGQCPLIDGDRVVLAPGGDALVVTVDLETGKVVWKSPNPRQAMMTHSSVTPVKFKDQRLYVYCANNGVYSAAVTMRAA